jgi:glycosyltransferase involved in cell wall biosynthesis
MNSDQTTRPSLRILHVFGGLLHGGAEALVMNYYRHIDTSVIQFDFLVHTPVVGVYEAEIQSRGGRIFRAPTFTGKNYLSYKKWWKEFLNQHPEYPLVHFHVRASSPIAIPLVKKAGRRTIMHSHTISNGISLSAVLKNLLQLSLRRNADYLFACSEAAGRWMFGRKAMRSGRVLVWNNAIDLSSYDYTPETRAQYRLEYGEDAFIVGHVGRFADEKNHRFLLDVFREIVRRNPAAVLLLVGDGPLREEMQKRAGDLGIEQSVRFLGSRDDVPKLLQAMDVFLFPSKFEGLGIVAIEAQAAGLPCIAATTVPDVIAITDLVQFVDLRANVGVWADAVMQYHQLEERVSPLEALANAGYDIRESTKALQEFYSTVATEMAGGV